MEKVIKNKLKISKVLYEFLENDVLLPLNVNSDLFWKGFEEIIYKFSPLNKKLLEKIILINYKIMFIIYPI